MNEIKTALAAMLYLLAKLSRFNAFAGGFAGFCYGMLANVLDREFLGLGATQITLLGIACFFVFFGLSIGITMLSNCLLSDAEEAVDSKIAAP